ncbi:MAG: T9SS type A sorting domain-containing protein [Bacteroidetes bacterium]|nr:MAG: T9SS type A sorting domain-containing protein [Bacteroidota bacterium]
MKKLNYYFGALLTTLVVTLLFGMISLHAQDVPNSPLNLTASLDSTGKDVAVRLDWQKDTTGLQPNYFFIYMAPMDTDDPSQFQFMSKIHIEHNQNDFHFLVHNLKSGHYSFYVTAVLMMNDQRFESNPSSIVKIELIQRPFVHVKPAEPIRGLVGIPITFTVKAETNTDCSILFELVKGPDGMTIDAGLGLVTWVPLVNGQFKFTVKATLACDTNVFGFGEFKVMVGDSSHNQAFVHIVSKPNERAKPGEPYTYEVKAESNINCPILFELLPEHPDGMTIDQQTGVISWTPLSAGSYHVGVRAYLECQPDVFAKQQFKVKVGDDTAFAMVKIVSRPIEHAAPNSQYVYEVKAETNTDCHILYELIEHPDGMTIDSNGRITWQTPADGSFHVAVKASLDCRPEISFTQKFTIKVGQGDDKPRCALIYGTATFDGDSTIVKEGVVKAWSIDSNSKDHPLYVGQIKNGEFSVRVNDGTFILVFSGPQFKEEWYENSRTKDSATKITVACGDSITLNVVLEKLPEPKHFKVSGKVTSESDGSPVMARIEFIPVEKMHGRDGHDDNKNGFQTKTDAEGNYEISLPNTFSYIAHAIPTTEDRKFADQYYNLVSDPLEADILVLTGDLTGIDFVLKQFEEKNNGFSGYVENQNGERIRAHVIAHLVNSNGHDKKYNRSVETDEQGNFSFNHLVVGEYILLSIPFDRIYVPGYYKLDDFVVLKWRDATRIEVGDSIIGEPFIVKHTTRDSILGVAHIEGNITANTLSIGKSGDHTQAGEPLAGAFVYILNENGFVSDYVFSDNLGNFEMSELGAGTYTLVADKIGYYSLEQTITTDYDSKSNVSVNFAMTELPTEVSDETNNINDALIYPSPSNNKATLRFDASAGSSKIILYGSNGMQLEEFDVQTVQGSNTFELNLGSQPNGAYFVRIINNNRIITIPVRVVR